MVFYITCADSRFLFFDKNPTPQTHFYHGGPSGACFFWSLRMLTALKFSLLLLTLFFLCQCETISSSLIEAPIIELKELKISSLSFEGVEFIALMNADNKNALDLNIDQIVYQMKIADKSLFTGSTKTPIVLKSSQNNQVEIPFEIKFKDAKEAFKEVIVNKNNNYTFDGTSKIGIFKVPFSKTGTLKIPSIKL